jgi:hypothetical protein
MIIGTEPSPSWRRQNLMFRPKSPDETLKTAHFKRFSLRTSLPCGRTDHRCVRTPLRCRGRSRWCGCTELRWHGTGHRCVCTSLPCSRTRLGCVATPARWHGTRHPCDRTSHWCGRTAYRGYKPLASIHLPLIFDDYSKLSCCAVHDRDRDDHGF